MRLLPHHLLKHLSIAGMCFFVFIETSHGAISQQFNQDAAGLGDAQAGGAASALDASTEFYNPAGLLLIQEQQVVFGSNLYMPTYDFDNSTTTSASGGAFSQQLYLHYAAPISSSWSFGFGVSSPFAMHSDWPNNSSAANNSTTTSLNTYDVSTDLAYAITSKLSIGAGFDFVRVIVSDMNYSSDTYSTSLSGSQWDKAWHGGILYQFTPTLRAGVAYHSKVNYEVSGDAVSLDNNGAVLQSTNNFVMTSTLPAYTTASVYYELNPVWAVEASVNYTLWTQAEEATYQNLPTNLGITPSTTQTYALQNTWRTALGVHYKVSSDMMLRAGAGYETSPYQNANTVYLGAPAGSSYDASLGLEYQYSKTLAFDLGWTHIFYLSQDVNTNNINGSTTVGAFSGSNDVVGAELRWDML